MNLRNALAGVLARDSRYTVAAYAFVFESLEHTKQLRKIARAKSRAKKARPPRFSGHVTGRELCLGLKDLALKQYGLMAVIVLSQCGIRSTSDVGEIVYNLIASGDFEKTPNDSRTDFDDVFDFDDAFRRTYSMPLDDVA